MSKTLRSRDSHSQSLKGVGLLQRDGPAFSRPKPVRENCKRSGISRGLGWSSGVRIEESDVSGCNIP